MDSTSEKTLIIVGCVKTKRELLQGEVVPASELYTSPLFAGRRRYALNSGEPWAILSAEHGLIDPSTPIATYDTTIKSVPRVKNEIVDWHKQVAMTLEDHAGVWGSMLVEIHAGLAYFDRLMDAISLTRAQVFFKWPVMGMQIGEQLRYYNQIKLVGES